MIIRESLARDLMGGPKGPPGGFSSTTQIRLRIALWHFQYLSGHQFYASSEQILPEVTMVKSYRGQTGVMLGRFCQKGLFYVKRRRAVDLQDTNSKFGPQT